VPDRLPHRRHLWSGRSNVLRRTVSRFLVRTCTCDTQCRGMTSHLMCLCMQVVRRECSVCTCVRQLQPTPGGRDGRRGGWQGYGRSFLLRTRTCTPSNRCVCIPPPRDAVSKIARPLRARSIRLSTRLWCLLLVRSNRGYSTPPDLGQDRALLSGSHIRFGSLAERRRLAKGSWDDRRWLRILHFGTPRPRHAVPLANPRASNWVPASRFRQLAG
jgi:hypothetical protein